MMSSEHVSESGARHEYHTNLCCLHPYYGFVCPPGATIDFSDHVPEAFGHRAVAAIDHEGFRNHHRPLRKPSNEVWIGLFGGSATFGAFSTSNDTTISGYLESMLNDRGGSRSRRVRVINYSILAGQQPQQSIILLLKRDELDGAICIDGVNEFIVPAWYNKGFVSPTFPYLPHYQALYGRSLSDKQLAMVWLIEREQRVHAQRPAMLRALWQWRHGRRIEEWRRQLAAADEAKAEFRSLFAFDEPPTLDAHAALAAVRWRQGVMAMHDLCRTSGLKALFALNPLPEIGKTLTPLEQSFLDGKAALIAARRMAYDKVVIELRTLREAGLPVEDFSDVFAGEQDSIYVDQVHFEDAGSRILAERLSKVIAEQWGELG